MSVSRTVTAGELPQIRPEHVVKWVDLAEIDLPPTLAAIMVRNFARPPNVVRAGMPLHSVPIDHLTFALCSEDEIYRTFDLLMTCPNVTEVDCPARWPQGDKGNDVDWRDHKFMATSVLPEGVQITLVAPCRSGDVVSEYLLKVGGVELHHIAFRVPEIASYIVQLLASSPAVRQISPLAIDDGLLSQVFFKFDPDHRLIELVQRCPGFEGGFTFRNIATLTAGERQSE